MAFEYTALPAAGADRSTEHGAYYKIINNADYVQNVGTTLFLGEGTTIFIDGNIGVVSRSGTLDCESLTLVANASAGGRIDFNNSANGASRGKRIQFVYQGNGQIYNHLEPIGMLQNTEQAEFIFAMSAGNGYIQFERREYQGVTLTVKSNHLAQIQLYVARSHNGQTDLPGFGVSGPAPSFITIRPGTVNSRGRILDPVYRQTGVIDNYYDLRVFDAPTADPILGWETGNDAGLKGVWELFTVDVTSIRHDDAQMRVVSGGNETFNKALTVANTTLYASNGTTPLAFYSGEYRVRVPVRFLQTTTTTRNSVSYRIRRKGYTQIDVASFVMNSPTAHNSMELDPSYDTGIDGALVTGIAVDSVAKTITLSANLTTQQIYNYLSYWLSLNLAVDNFVSFPNSVLTLSSGYELIASGFSVDGVVSDVNGTTGKLSLL